MTDRDKYFDLIVLRVVAGEECGQWEKLIDFLMTCDIVNYRKVSAMYPELMMAIKRYKKAHQGITEAKLERRVK